MRLKFGDCVLDLRARRLERGNEVVPLEPKMFNLLELLITRRPAVITNNELDELLWPNVYVARTSLTRLVSELRDVLGDTPRDSRIIRTVYKTGYAFCAEVTVLPAVRSTPATIEVLWMKQSLPLTEGEHIAGRDAECSLVIDGYRRDPHCRSQPSRSMRMHRATVIATPRSRGQTRPRGRAASVQRYAFR